jgi:hypothetical protein
MNEKEVKRFLRQLARMETESEIAERTGGQVTMRPVCAVDTLSWAIREARSLLEEKDKEV